MKMLTYYRSKQKILIKEKLSTIKTSREIIQVLTLAPKTWSIKKVANFFTVTEYAARKARSLAQEKGRNLSFT